MDGPRHRGLHPHGRRGRQLDRRGALLQPQARLPEPRRRHLQPLRRPRDPRRARGGRQHHLQDPLQRRRRHDRRPARTRAASRRSGSPASWSGDGRRSTVVGVYDPKEDIDRDVLPAGSPACASATSSTPCSARCEEVPGVSAILYIQTCAAEKRRRRKRGTFPDPDRRVFINPDVCEGCGDCGVQSNCVSILPLETEFGRKRAIDQSSLQQGLLLPRRLLPELRHPRGREGPQGRARAASRSPTCPRRRSRRSTAPTTSSSPASAAPASSPSARSSPWPRTSRARAPARWRWPASPRRAAPSTSTCRIAERPADISAIRVAVGEADALIGGDLVTSAGAKTLGLMARGRTRAVRQRPRDHHRRLHPRPRLPAPDRPPDARAARPPRRGRPAASSTPPASPRSSSATRSTPTS